MNQNIKQIIPLTSQDLIKSETEKLIANVRASLNEVKTVALAEAWKILQLAVASVIQIIEAFGNDLSGPDKKALAMDILSKFYDSVFIVVDIPIIPNVFEPLIHRYVKAILMILVSSTIDALVTTFRNTGVFIKRESSKFQA